MHSKKPAILERKYSVDGLKFMTNKGEVSGIIKDKNSPALNVHKNGRTETSAQELNNTTSEKTNRRAEIVAAVTKRLYSQGKRNSEDNKLESITTAQQAPSDTSTEADPVTDNPVLELPAMTKIRLQEISRKMLAKRRRIIADTQTDFYESTTRVKHVHTLTDKVKKIDASVLTDEHEELTMLENSAHRVKRVKEIATLTEKLPTMIIRFKDATCVTEDYEDDSDHTSNRPEMSEDKKSDTNNLNAKDNQLVDESTNTMGDFDNISSSIKVQSKGDRKATEICKEDICYEHRCSLCGTKLGKTFHEDKGKLEKNVISITLPEDILRITLETTNILESSISITEENVNKAKEPKYFRDSQNQTDFARKHNFLIKPPWKYNFFNERHRFPSRAYNLAAVDSKFRKKSTSVYLDKPTYLGNESLWRYSSKSHEIGQAFKWKNVPSYSGKLGHSSSPGPSSGLAGNSNEKYKRSLPYFGGTLWGNGKGEESVDSIFDLITEEVSNKMTELKRLHDTRDIFLNKMSPRSDARLKPWHNLKSSKIYQTIVYD